MAITQAMATSFKVEILDGIHNFGTAVAVAVSSVIPVFVAFVAIVVFFLVGSLARFVSKVILSILFYIFLYPLKLMYRKFIGRHFR